jgi:hypothetical protein
MRSSRAPITSGESHSFSTIDTMLSMIFSRRLGMIAVCAIGMPSGWRNSAVTANQSARPPTTAASNPAAKMCSQVSPASGPVASAIRDTRAPATATTSETAPTRFRRTPSAPPIGAGRDSAASASGCPALTSSRSMSRLRL